MRYLHMGSWNNFTPRVSHLAALLERESGGKMGSWRKFLVAKSRELSLSYLLASLSCGFRTA